MDFGSIYQHGFVRVAACTGGVAIADPPVNAELVLRSARECSEEGVVVALFPEMTLTGYSVETWSSRMQCSTTSSARWRRWSRVPRTSCR